MCVAPEKIDIILQNLEKMKNDINDAGAKAMVISNFSKAGLI